MNFILEITRCLASECSEGRSCLAKCFVVAGLVVLTSIEIVYSFALCFFAIDVNVLLAYWLLLEKTGIFLTTCIHPLKNTGGPVGIISQTWLFFLFFALFAIFVSTALLLFRVNTYQSATQTAVLRICSHSFVIIDRSEWIFLIINYDHLWQHFWIGIFLQLFIFVLDSWQSLIQHAFLGFFLLDKGIISCWQMLLISSWSDCCGIDCGYIFVASRGSCLEEVTWEIDSFRST